MKEIKRIETTIVVHGKWVEDEDCFCCNKCGCAIEEENVPLFNFCPYCGADMRKSQ
jgi:hypothetical protein